MIYLWGIPALILVIILLIVLYKAVTRSRSSMSEPPEDDQT